MSIGPVLVINAEGILASWQKKGSQIGLADELTSCIISRKVVKISIERIASLIGFLFICHSEGEYSSRYRRMRCLSTASSSTTESVLVVYGIDSILGRDTDT